MYNNQYFISHFDNTNQIDLSYGTSCLLYIILIFIFLVFFSGRKLRHGNFLNDVKANDHFSYETTMSLRGIALITLLLGHLSEKCIEGCTFLEDGGRWAVVIFLYLSGVSLAKSYGLVALGKRFMLSRLRRIAVPFWLTLALFIVLDYFLNGYYYSFKRIIPAIFGIMYPWPPMGHTWFVTYIIFQYLLFYLVSLFRIGMLKKIITLFLLSYFSMLLIITTRLFNYFALWVIYTVVFPAAVFIGMYRRKIFHYLKVLYERAMPLYFASMIVLLALYFGMSAHGWLSQPDNVMRTVHTLQPLSMVFFLTMLSFIVDSFGYKSSILNFLGEYSYEIYLVHFPFIEYYDFVLFRRPLIVYFYIYFVAIILMSYLVRKLSNNLNQMILFRSVS